MSPDSTPSNRNPSSTQPHWHSLTQFYLSSSFAFVLKMLASMMVLAVLFSLKEGLTVVNLSQYAALGTAFFIALTGLSVMKLKFDGSMTFLATLPITAVEHAKAATAASAVWSLPSAFFLSLSLSQQPLDLTSFHLLAVFTTLVVFSTVVSVFIAAVQLKSEPGKFGIFSYLMTFIFLFSALSEYIAKLRPVHWFISLPPMTILYSIGLLAWAIAALAFVWSWRSIGRTMAFIPIKQSDP